jgi:hypothetical protein
VNRQYQTFASEKLVRIDLVVNRLFVHAALDNFVGAGRLIHEWHARGHRARAEEGLLQAAVCLCMLFLRIREQGIVINGTCN